MKKPCRVTLQENESIGVVLTDDLDSARLFYRPGELTESEAEELHDNINDLLYLIAQEVANFKNKAKQPKLQLVK